MEPSENLLTDTLTTSTDVCSAYKNVEICSTYIPNPEGGYAISTHITFPQPYIISTSEPANEVLMLSEQDREVIRVREVRYDAVPGTDGVYELDHTVTVAADEYQYEEIATISLITEPTDYARPKVPKSIVKLL